jgi:hypothetical protein
MNTVPAKAYLGRRVLARGHAALDAQIWPREGAGKEVIIDGKYWREPVGIISVSLSAIWAVWLRLRSILSTVSPGQCDNLPG